MRASPASLSAQEKAYARRVLAGIRFALKYSFIPPLLITLVGILFLFLSGEEGMEIFGALFVILGIAWFIFNRIYHGRARLSVLPERREHTGRLHFELVGLGTKKYLTAFVDGYQLLYPHVFDGYLHQLVDKYGKEAVSVSLAVAKLDAGEQENTFHVLLRIGDDLCLSGINRPWGRLKLRLCEVYVYLRYSLGVLVAGALSLVGFGISDMLPETLGDIVFFLLILPAFLGGFWVALKITPDEAGFLRNFLKCG